MYDLIILGGGSAGIGAGIYAARKKIKTLIITESFNGHFVVASEIRNFIGSKSISGIELSKKLEEHIRDQEGIEIREGSKASSVEKKDGFFIIKTDQGEVFETKTILSALGSRYRRLNISGENKFEGKGVFYCSICDAPLMKDKVAVVVGGGNTGFNSIIDLLPYASEIYLIEHKNALVGDLAILDKIMSSGKVNVVTMAEVEEIFGDKFVSGLKYKYLKTGELKEIKTEGIFVAIGYNPNSDLFKNLVELDRHGAITVDHKTQKTSCEGIWAAGDITDVLYHQINIAIGDGIKAALNIYDYLKDKK